MNRKHSCNPALELHIQTQFHNKLKTTTSKGYITGQCAGVVHIGMVNPSSLHRYKKDPYPNMQRFTSVNKLQKYSKYLKINHVRKNHCNVIQTIWITDSAKEPKFDISL